MKNSQQYWPFWVDCGVSVLLRNSSFRRASGFLEPRQRRLKIAHGASRGTNA
jgi:hypothetical protein